MRPEPTQLTLFEALRPARAQVTNDQRYLEILTHHEWMITQHPGCGARALTHVQVILPHPQDAAYGNVMTVQYADGTVDSILADCTQAEVLTFAEAHDLPVLIAQFVRPSGFGDPTAPPLPVPDDLHGALARQGLPLIA
ncbi:hypothetical protein [Deinococcus soli (ex Cha et al. 2016)]|uniref:Uncharacterized protein n=2 Tax=Deinococcus soli (ex Cha et al. 2016) TaxID=1309411 RepID=A0AAE4BM95_9DEIO|nr:hypothetical protein [Deinococcus soli (ex Cha et al. 2016)]MDR6218272.1 hypothetical protein [Deinococcus soli (ex Cha et al. 2016)]MDR6329012.1 hypothetical protein [Deinococcus soli (ex Cha et al. 2016)]MDR6751285.1 hypothetical protein [Deinococcus soli (ex Cha et al. 2016)]